MQTRWFLLNPQQTHEPVLSMPRVAESDRPVGVLVSGGLDSCILVGDLLRAGRRVQPFYVRTDVVWAGAETLALCRFLAHLKQSRLRPLVSFEMPLGDLYGPHWSLTGEATPDANSPDAAVFLPGRNALLALKPLLWCQEHGVTELALATLAGNPFPDASEGFCRALATALQISGGNARPVALTRPFASLDKMAVLRRGRGLPLEHTFSCIAPQGSLHCGQCNKCHERRVAFAAAGFADPTNYAERSPLVPLGAPR